MDGSRHDKVYFLPGYPKIDRCTVNGTHYIQGQLLEKSVFGQDPFEPVKMSYIPDIIAQQTSLKCACVKRNEALNDIKSDERIVICDVEKHKRHRRKGLMNCRKKMSFVLLPDVPHLRKRLPTSSDLMQ